ncbi:unnamed protein product, partial [marine sediment metagenome]
MPIIENLLLSAEDLCLRIETTDLDTTIQAEVDTITTNDAQFNGRVCVNSVKFCQAVEKLRTEKIHILFDAEEQELKIGELDGSASVTLQTVLADSFPLLLADNPARTDAEYFHTSVSVEDFTRTIKQVLPATSDELERFQHATICADLKDMVLELAATDSRRMAIQRVTVQESSGLR